MTRRLIPKRVVLAILEAAAQTPSGGNSQPWRFEVEPGALHLYMLPEKDHPVLNCRNRGTLLAHGMLIETIAIAARHHGFSPLIDILPVSDQPAFTAKIRFEESRYRPADKLFEAIWSRCTNRKPYRVCAIEPAIQASLRAVGSEVGENDSILAFTAAQQDLENLAQAASTSERVTFENRLLHRLLFKELVWSKSEATQRGSGLQIETLEIQRAQRIALKLFQHYPVMRLLNAVGAARSIAKENAAVYASCSLYGAIGCGSRDVDFIQAGRVVGRLWLKAASLGLSFHLQSGVNFLWQGLVEGTVGCLSKKHVELIERDYQTICRVFKLRSNLIPAIFRIGYGGEPSARSIKKAPDIRSVDVLVRSLAAKG